MAYFFTGLKNKDVYEKEYVLEKAFINIDRDGAADTLYQKKGQGHYFAMERSDRPLNKSLMTNFIDEFFYYRGKPYFIGRQLTGVNIK